MAASKCLIETLPNEILATSLAYLSTRELIHLVSVSRCFYTLVTRLLHRRLVDVSPLPHNQLILECYHPSAKLSTPTLSCNYVGLREASEEPITDESLEFSHLRQLYSSFRPVVAEEDFGRRGSGSQVNGRLSMDDRTATQDVNLDPDEVFTQLCAITAVVKSGPRPGFFISHVNTCDGFIRIWRQWLAGKASANGSDGASKSRCVDFDDFLWVGPDKDVGLRFRVVLGPAERMPLLSRPDDWPVSYTLIYEELIIRTTTLLMAVEASTGHEEASRTTKAVIIAQF